MIEKQTPLLFIKKIQFQSSIKIPIGYEKHVYHSHKGLGYKYILIRLLRESEKQQMGSITPMFV